MRALLAVFSAALLVGVGALWWLKFEHHPPQAALARPLDALGRSTPFDINLSADAPGLRAVEVRLQAGGTSYALLSDTYPAANWRGSGLRAATVHVAADLGALKVPEGPATLEVYVDGYAWHLLPHGRVPRLTQAVTVHLTPPKVELLTTQHNARLGGMELAVFRQSADAVQSGIAVDK